MKKEVRLSRTGCVYTLLIRSVEEKNETSVIIYIVVLLCYEAISYFRFIDLIFIKDKLGLKKYLSIL